MQKTSTLLKREYGTMTTIHHYGVFSNNARSKAHDIIIDYMNKNDHSILAHETARCEIMNLIGIDGFNYNDYKIWCQRLNDIDNNKPITSSFIGNPNYKPL